MIFIVTKSPNSCVSIRS